jgi:hypothetical protein
LAASHNPQVLVMYQEVLIALAWYTFMLEVQAKANCEKDKRKHRLFGLKLENLATEIMFCCLPKIWEIWQSILIHRRTSWAFKI